MHFFYPTKKTALATVVMVTTFNNQQQQLSQLGFRFQPAAGGHKFAIRPARGKPLPDLSQGYSRRFIDHLIK